MISDKVQHQPKYDVSDFLISFQLTGIQRSQVDGQPHLTEILEKV